MLTTSPGASFFMGPRHSKTHNLTDKIGLLQSRGHSATLSHPLIFHTRAAVWSWGQSVVPLPVQSPDLCTHDFSL